jgi:cytochrome bd ubiquinol oxidase subunit II
MWLNYIWFVLFVLIITGYLILDGYDLGVGILHLFVAGSDEERRINLNSIGPVWDGNEVWLVLAGGALFGAFPIVYASLFSGFYEAMILLLLFLILRTVSIEFRSKREGERWRRGWDTVFGLSSTVLALLLGIVFGNIVSGVPIDQQGNITIASILELLHPFALLVGVTTVVMLALHGTYYLNLKTEGQVQARVRRYVPRLLGLLAVLGVLTDGSMLVAGYQAFAVYRQIWPILLPLGAAAAAIGAWLLLRRERAFAAFVCSSTMVALLLFSVAVGLFPNLLISTTDPEYNLTVLNAASQPETLLVMLIMAVIGIPFVLLYTGGVFYLFRGKVRLSSDSY